MGDVHLQYGPGLAEKREREGEVEKSRGKKKEEKKMASKIVGFVGAGTISRYVSFSRIPTHLLISFCGLA